jgi:hypothetical protein
MADKQVFTASKSQTITLPNPKLVADGTKVTIQFIQEWTCRHEGEHAYWERPFIITVEPPDGH